MVRNPWSRAFSLYGNVMRDPIHQRTLRVAPDTTFSDFIQVHAGRGMLQPQTYWLRSFRGAVPMDFVGRFENLHCDFDHACKIARIDAPELPHEIRGASESYQKHYDARSRQLVQSVYGEEIEMFGYAFD